MRKTENRPDRHSMGADPRPMPPERPGNNECCQSGCSPCIFDLYQEDLDRYRDDLRAWEQRQAHR